MIRWLLSTAVTLKAGEIVAGPLWRAFVAGHRRTRCRTRLALSPKAPWTRGK